MTEVYKITSSSEKVNMEQSFPASSSGEEDIKFLKTWQEQEKSKWFFIAKVALLWNFLPQDAVNGNM